MVDPSLLELVKKFGRVAISIASAIGLLSIFAVHVSGFLFFLPQSLWPLIDVYFVSGLLVRFSLFLAVAFLAARYATYLLSAALGGVLSIALLPFYFAHSKYRRYSRRSGVKLVAELAMNLNGAEKKYEYNYKSFTNWVSKSILARYTIGVVYFSGRIRGAIDFRVSAWSIVIQGATVLAVLSQIYIDTIGALIVFSTAIFLLIFFPPSPWEAYFSRPYAIYGVNPASFFRLDFLKFFTLPKITVLALTLSFLLGIFHHKALLLQEILVIDQFGEEDRRSILVVTASGFIFFEPRKGYWYVESQNRDFKSFRPNTQTQ